MISAPVATLIATVSTAIVYAWRLADPDRVEDVLFLANAPLYAEPWRTLTSTFIHRITPHFVFNLLTLWWFGRAVEQRYGPGTFAVAFLGALWTGQMFTLLVGLLPLHGVSGGVCGLYGFLVAADWRDNLYRTIKQRPAYWLYPVALVALLVADRMGLVHVANLNHVVAIAYGALVGRAITSRGHGVAWRTSVALFTVIVGAWGAYRWERPWQHLASVAPLDCSISRRPIGDVTKNEFVRVVLVDDSARPKSIRYVEPSGETVVVSRNSRRTYRLLPYIGSIWRIEDDRVCRAQFEVTHSGKLTLK